MNDDKILWIDTETTGIDLNNDKICEISFKITDLSINIVEQFHWYVNPQKESCKEAFDKHQLTTEFLKEYKTFNELSDEIYTLLVKYKYIAGYNILQFDIPLLIEEFSNSDIYFKFNEHTYIDPYRMLVKYESRKLDNVYKRLLGKPMSKFHSANDDVQATIDIFPKIIEKFNITTLSEDLITYDKNLLDFNGNLLLDNDNKIIINFGKYKGNTIDYVLDKDQDYIFWVLEKADKIANTTKQIITNYLNQLTNG